MDLSLCVVCMPTVDARFLRGLELFNHREFFESHEVIEELWLETPKTDPNRDLYQGVIQAAAAVYQFQREIHSGARGLYKSSVKYLEKYAPSALGLNVEKLIAGLHRCFKDSTLDPASIPVLEYMV